MPAPKCAFQRPGDGANGRLKLVERGFGVAGLEEGGAQVQMRERVVGRQFERLTQARDCRGPLALAKGVGAAQFKRARVLEHAGHLTHQRIGGGDIDVAAQSEIRVGVARARSRDKREAGEKGLTPAVDSSGSDL